MHINQNRLSSSTDLTMIKDMEKDGVAVNLYLNPFSNFTKD